MKITSVVILLLWFANPCSGEDSSGKGLPSWVQTTFKETPLDHFYVGVSDGRKSLTSAREEAYLEAVKEAVRHNFGFNQKLVANFHANLNKVEHSESLLIHQDEINLKGITPVQEYFERNKDGSYKLWRQIKYPKSFIAIEQKRLKEAKPLEGIVNFITTPVGADIYIENKKIGKSPLLGVRYMPGNFDVRYEMPGYFSETQKIVVRSNQNTPARNIYLKKIPEPKREVATDNTPNWFVRSMNFIFSSEKSEEHRFTYSPVVNEEGKTWFHLIPFSYDRHYVRKFSLGVDAHYMYDESGETSDPNTESLFHGSANFKIWPFRNDFFSIGVGGEYNYRFYRKKTIQKNYDYNNSYSENKTKTIIEKESHGVGAIGTVLLPFNSARTKGLQIDYRKVDLSNSNKDYVAVGIFFEF
ncbi:MAG: PEGA domain-containing protein [Deltaproteobacteria bacterium]|nr:MAG: PEGA domain-containing protein [Deltaproteobacteria bacterium]